MTCESAPSSVTQWIFAPVLVISSACTALMMGGVVSGGGMTITGV